jgi:MFS family permease
MKVFRKKPRQIPALLWRLVAAAAASSLGDGLLVAALPLLAVSLTSSPLLVSALAVASGLPWLLVALPAGALADRWDKRRLVVVVELGRAATLGLLAAGVITGTIDLAGLYVAAFLIGVGETFVAAVTRSVVPLIVDDEDDLPSANGYVFAAETAGERFAGPAIGGVIFGVLTSLPFFGDGLSFLASAVLLRSAIPAEPARRVAPPSTGVFRDVRTGVGWFLGHAHLRILALVVTTFAFCQAMAFAVLVLFATRTLHLDAGGYGLILAVAAIGNVAASVVAGRVHRHLGQVGTIVVGGVVAGAAYLAIGLTHNLVVATAALLLEAAAVTLGNVATLSARHRLIPVARFGIINNAFRMCVMGVVPVGSLVGGGLAALTSVPTTFVAAGVIQLAGLLGVALPLRAISRDSTEPVAANEAEPASSQGNPGHRQQEPPTP